MDVIVLKDKILVAYIQNNKYCVEVLDRMVRKLDMDNIGEDSPICIMPPMMYC